MVAMSGKCSRMSRRNGSCPVCGGRSGYSIDGMGTHVCDQCGALFVASPFGPELISRDARERFPRLGQRCSVVAWDRDGE